MKIFHLPLGHTTVCKKGNSNHCKDRCMPLLQYINPFNPGNVWGKDTKQ